MDTIPNWLVIAAGFKSNQVAQKLKMVMDLKNV